MILQPVNFILGIFPIIFYMIGMKLEKKEVESWIFRKYYHILLHSLLGIYAMIHETIIEFVITLAIFVFFTILLSLTPALSINSIFQKGKRENEKIISLHLNNKLTLITAILLLIFTSTWIFALANLVVGIGDGFGEVIGKPLGRIKYKIFKNKSVEGSIGVFTGAFISLIMVNNFYVLGFTISFLLIFSAALMLIEAFSFSFLDNIFLQLATLYLYFI